MATIRVILLTCRRPALLRRALASLLAQTHADWVCELHNDAPEDDSPQAILAELAGGDPRFTYNHHVPAWGAVRSFNYCFLAGPEPYISLLEDDNWWEPALLASLLEALSLFPTASLAWANMRVWQENQDSTWTDTGRTIWPSTGQPRLFNWPSLVQAFDGLHSNGAMLFRKAMSGRGAVPPETPFALIEPVRERTLAGPFVLVPEVLANYSLTRSTARSADRTLWVQGQLLLAGSFFEEVDLAPQAWDELWRASRLEKPPRTGMLLMVALSGIRRREIMARAGTADLLRFSVSFLGSLRANLAGLRFRTDHPRLWEWLRENSSARTRETGLVPLRPGSVLVKNPQK